MVNLPKHNIIRNNNWNIRKFGQINILNLQRNNPVFPDIVWTIAPANGNEKKHAPKLFKKALRVTKKRMKLVVADSQYSCKGQREQVADVGVRVVIPYPVNQMRGQKGLLRVDR
jgi:hypothetical protein